jgi:ankyrin repeat protein
LIEYGANIAARNPAGRTAADLAHGIGWFEIAACLDELAGGAPS